MRRVIRKLGGFFVLGALCSVAVPEAWSANEPPDTKLVERGRTVWLTAAGIGCASCHGRYGEGDVGIGPYNRGVSLSKIQAAVAAVPQMRVVKDKLDQRDIEAVAAYVSWLGQLQLVKTLLKRDRFIPDAVEIYPGTAVQLVVNNSGQAARRFASENMEVAEFQVGGREAYDFVWHAPDKEGTYVLRCQDCAPKDQQQLTINVRRTAKPYVPVVPERTAR